MAGTVVADQLEAASTSTLVIKNGVANTPPTIQDSAGTQIGTFCRAWVNFNGTGTVAIRASFNVTSITDNGTGDYTVNFTTAMPDANYAVAITASAGNNNSALVCTVKSAIQYGAPSNQTTTACQIVLINYVNSAIDTGAVYVSIFR
jgi:hypothetical protein